MITTDITLNEQCNSLNSWIKVEFLSIEEIDTAFPIYGNMHLSKNCDKWSFIQQAGKTVKQSCEYNDEGTYDHDITINIGCRGNNYSNYFNTMSNDRFIVKLTSSNGKEYVAGDIETPLRFSWSDTNEDSATTLRFYGECNYPLMPLKEE